MHDIYRIYKCWNVAYERLQNPLAYGLAYFVLFSEWPNHSISFYSENFILNDGSVLIKSFLPVIEVDRYTYYNMCSCEIFKWMHLFW